MKLEALRNPFEVKTFKDLKAILSQDKVQINYESEKIPYTTTHVYVPDFVLEWKDGHKVYIETKGYLRREDAEKMIAVKKQHPDLDIRILFEKDNRVSNRHKMRYSTWAEKYGFPYAIKKIPDDWFK